VLPAAPLKNKKGVVSVFQAINMAPLTGFRSAAPLPGCTSRSVGAGLDPLATVKGAKLEKLVALPEDAEDGRTPITL